MAAVYSPQLWALAVVLSCNIVCGHMFDNTAKEDSEDVSGWLDPTDMINYDLAARKMRNVEVCPFTFCDKLFCFFQKLC